MSAILTTIRIREPMLAGTAAAFVALALQGCGGSSSPAPLSSMPPTLSLSVSTDAASNGGAANTITLGQSPTLTWGTALAASCTASGGWSGSQALSGTTMVTPTTTGAVSYTLTCINAGGQSTSETVTVTVNAASVYTVTNLVADTAGAAAHQDAKMVNGWGLTFAPNDPVWTSNNGSNTTGLYKGDGSFIVDFDLPAPVGTAPEFEPTGVVWWNNPNEFIVSANGKSGGSQFIYSGLAGQLAGWSGAVSTTAILAYTATDGACYRGLAIANNGTADFLYANDFKGAKIDVFDWTFTKQAPTAFPFTDPNLPANYAPFNIQAFANGPKGTWQIYVSYAMSGTGANKGSCEDTRGAGFGMVSVFTPNGKLVQEFVPIGGWLNAPWGMAWAPANFGTLSNAFLVSNHADGTIHAYAADGTYLGAVQTANGPFAQTGLWGIAFGNNGVLTMGGQSIDLAQPSNTLFFTAGPNGGNSGLYGRIDPPAM